MGWPATKLSLVLGGSKTRQEIEKSSQKSDDSCFKPANSVDTTEKKLKLVRTVSKEKLERDIMTLF